MQRRVLCLVFALVLLLSLTLPAFASADGDTIVYRTRTGECYHLGSCGYLRSSKIEITLADAVARGLRPCSRCNPPRYTAESSAKSAPEPTQEPSYSSSSSTSRATTSSIPEKTILNPYQQIDTESFKEQQKQMQAEIDEMKQRNAELESYIQSSQKSKSSTTSTGSTKGINVLAVIIGIGAFIFMGKYVLEKLHVL